MSPKLINNLRPYPSSVTLEAVNGCSPSSTSPKLTPLETPPEGSRSSSPVDRDIADMAGSADESQPQQVDGQPESKDIKSNEVDPPKPEVTASSQRPEEKDAVTVQSKEVDGKQNKKDGKKKHRKHAKAKKMESDSSESSTSDSSSSSSSESDESSSEEELSRKKKKQEAKAKKAKKLKEKKKAKAKSKSKAKDSSSESDSEEGSSSSEDEKLKAKKKKKKKKSMAKERQRKSRETEESDEDGEDSDGDMIRRMRAMAGFKPRMGSRGMRDPPAYAVPPTKSAKRKVGKKSVSPIPSPKFRVLTIFRGSKADFVRVDKIWDTNRHNYVLKPTAEDPDVGEYDQYVFQVRRKFDWENKYQNTVLDIKSKALKDALKEVMHDVKGVSFAEDTPVVDPNMIFLYLEEIRAHMKKLRKLGKTEKPLNKKQKKKGKIPAKTKAKHTKVLIKYLDKDYAETKKTLYPLLESNRITFDLLWALYKSNEVAYCPTYSNPDEPRAFKIEYANMVSDLLTFTWL